MTITLPGRKLTKLQQIVCEFTDRFEVDPEVRYQLFAHTQSRTAWALSRKETESLPKTFLECPSGIWCREAVRGYLEYLEIVLLGYIRGERIPTILCAENAPVILRAEALRSEWLRVPRFQEAVGAFIESLRETFTYFNCQLVTILIRETVSYLRHEGPEPPFVREMSCEDAIVELRDMEDALYAHARVLYSGTCSRTYMVMEQMPGVDMTLKRLFLFTKEQLMAMAACYKGNHSIQPEEIVSMDQPPPASVPAWAVAASGLIIPGRIASGE